MSDGALENYLLLFFMSFCFSRRKCDEASSLAHIRVDPTHGLVIGLRIEQDRLLDVSNGGARPHRRCMARTDPIILG